MFFLLSTLSSVPVTCPVSFISTRRDDNESAPFPSLKVGEFIPFVKLMPAMEDKTVNLLSYFLMLADRVRQNITWSP